MHECRYSFIRCRIRGWPDCRATRLSSQKEYFVETGDAEFVRRAQAGNSDAFATLVERHQGFVYNLALRVIGSPQEAEDLAQEAFVRAWLALPNFRGQAQFRTWLYRIVTNLCYNRLPGLRRELLAAGEDGLDEIPASPWWEADPATSAEAQEQRAYLHQQIDCLPPSYRLLVTLRYQDGLSYEEIARLANMPLGTVKTGLFRAKAQLRQALQLYEEAGNEQPVPA
jgi:RNA polymerase sigma-70 factor (ECF subfamily)